MRWRELNPIALAVVVMGSCATRIGSNDAVSDGGGPHDAGPPAYKDRCQQPPLEPFPPPLRTFYVDGSNGDDSKDGLTQQTAWRTITRANQAVRPGDLVRVVGAFTGQAIQPTASGTLEHPIVFRGEGSPRASLQSPLNAVAIQIAGKAHVAVEGFAIAAATAPFDFVNTHHATMRDLHISVTGGSRLIDSSDNRFEANDWTTCGANCFFLSGNSHRNQWVGNHFGVSTSFSLIFQGADANPSTDNTVAFNVFENPLNGNLFVAGSATKTSVVCNVMRNAGTQLPGSDLPSAALLIANEDNVVFGNLFVSNRGEGFRLQSVGTTSTHDASRNLIHHNVFYDNGGPAVRVLRSAPNTNPANNHIENNIFWGNTTSDDSHWTVGDTRFQVVFDHFHTGELGFADGGTNGTLIRNNLIARSAETFNAGWLFIIGSGKTLQLGFSDAQTQYPTISGNVVADPRFWHAAGGQFMVQRDSPVRDRGHIEPNTVLSGAAPEPGRYELE